LFLKIKAKVYTVSSSSKCQLARILFLKTYWHLL
jgi:hypothetical protein